MDYHALARQFAVEAGIDPDVFERQIQQESGFNPNAYNPSGATGIAQIIPRWHPGVDANDPVASLRYAANLMASHLANYGGDYAKALAAYNWGPGNLASYGLSQAPAETRNYIGTILGSGGGGKPPGGFMSAGADPDPSNPYGPTGNGYGPGGGGGTTSAPKVGDAIETPYGTLIVVGVDEFGNPKYQYISPRTSADPNYTHVTERLIDPNQLAISQQQRDTANAALLEQARQFNEKMGMDKARGDQQMRINQAQQALAEAEAAGMYQGQPTEKAREFNTSNALDYYKWLSEKSSNPRNFVESFLARRGAPVPPGAEQYSNLAPVRAFGQGFMQGAPQQSHYQSPPTPYSPSAPAAPVPLPAGAPSSRQTIPVGPGGAISDWARAHGYTASTPASPAPTAGGSPTTADTAMIGGVKTWAGGPYAGRAVADSPANAGDLSPYLQNPNTPDPTGRVTQQFARGGIVPEPVVGRGVVTGQPYSFGEKGPEGVVPAQYLPRFLQSRAGRTMRPGTRSYDIGGLIGTQDPQQQPFPAYEGPSQYDPTAPPPSPTTAAPPSGKYLGGNLFPSATAPELQLTDRAIDPTAPSSPPPPSGGGYSRPIDIIPGQSQTPDSTMVPNATPQGQSGNFWGGGSIKSYLPTFLPGEDSGVLGQFEQEGIVPPFLNRIFGQQQGAKDIGTNTPNPMVLPKAVPLVSRLAYDQMLPTERSAFESYLSSYGIDPTDYWSYVDYVSPHGPSASQPLFGNRFQYQGQ